MELYSDIDMFIPYKSRLYFVSVPPNHQCIILEFWDLTVQNIDPEMRKIFDLYMFHQEVCFSINSNIDPYTSNHYYMGILVSSNDMLDKNTNIYVDILELFKEQISDPDFFFNSLNLELHTKETDGCVDVFDVCATNRVQENRGKSSTIFDILIRKKCELYPDIKFSLGVMFENQLFDSAIKMYLKAGFGNPKLSRFLYNDFQPFNFLKLTIEQCKSIDTNKLLVDRNLKISKSIRKLELENITKTRIEIIISKNVDEYLKTLLNRVNETGSGFVLEKIDENDRFELVYACDFEFFTKGIKFEAKPPEIPIYMHTHPKICLDVEKCFYAWPSTNDWMNDFTRTRKFLVQGIPTLSLVISKEGYYTQQITKMMANFMTDPSLEIFCDFITFYVGMFILSIEKARKDIPELYRLHSYINRMNHMSINSIVDEHTKYLDKVIEYIQTGQSSEFDNYSGFRGTLGHWIKNDNPIYKFGTLMETRDVQGVIDFYIEYKQYLVSFVENGGIFTDEPLFVCQLMDDFIQNPNQKQSSFFYYDYTPISLYDASNTVNLMENEPRDFTDGIAVRTKFLHSQFLGSIYSDTCTKSKDKHILIK